ncbi:MAG: hypothetical protein MW690_000814 [Methanophagales archaeon]|nr:hypothetical protein [Methanophagales archaeon]
MRLRTSETEIKHLLVAWLAISLAFTILFERTLRPQFVSHFPRSLHSPSVSASFCTSSHTKSSHSATALGLSSGLNRSCFSSQFSLLSQASSSQLRAQSSFSIPTSQGSRAVKSQSQVRSRMSHSLSLSSHFRFSPHFSSPLIPSWRRVRVLLPILRRRLEK